MKRSFFSQLHIPLFLALIACAFLGFFVNPQTAIAQPLPQINYQGKLTDTTGQAVPNGDYNMRFYLYNTTGGATTTAIWDEERTGGNQVTVTDGLFSVMIGSVDPLNISFDQTLYLGVEIGATGTPAWDGEMTPRKVLGTVPAAFQAERASTSDRFGGLATTSFLRSDQADSMDAFLTLTSGASSSDLIVSGTASTTNLAVGSDFISDLTGTGLTITGNALGVATTSLGLGDGTLDGLSDVNTTGALSGNLLLYDGSNWATTSTSTLNIALSDTLGTLAVTRGGTGATSFSANELLVGNGTGALTTLATSSLGFNESLFTDGGATTYLTALSDSLAIGTSTVSDSAKLDVWGDFQVGTGSVPTLFADTSTNWVGIGTTSRNFGSGATTTERLTVAGGGIIANDPSNPQIVGGVDTAGGATSVTVAGRYAYVADDANGLEIIDVSDPANPSIVGGVDTDGDALGVTIAGRYAYVADESNGLEIIDVSDPTNPTIVGGVDTAGFANAVTVAGRYAYVADQGNGLEIIDVSDPQNPSIVGGVDTDGNAYGVTLAGRYAYVADESNGLEIIDVSDPTNPTIVGGVDTDGNAFGVTLAGRYAYVADLNNGLEIIDVSDPTNPMIVGGVDTAGVATTVTVAGRYAYVADNLNGLEIIDVSDPTNPTIVSGVDTAGTAFGVTIAGRYAYVADGGNGLTIIDIGGSEFSSLFAGALGATQANFDQDLTVGQNALVQSNLNVGNDARVGGLLSIQGYSSSTDTRQQALLSLGGEDTRNSFLSFLGGVSSTTQNTWSLGLDNTDGAFRIASSSGLNTNNFFSILNTGNVGIGTTSPSSKLTVAGDGFFGGTLTATGTLDVQGSGTSTFAGNLDLTGNLALTGALYDGLGTAGLDGYILQTTGTSTQWVATSTLGFAAAGSGVTTFLGLSDTPNAYTADRVLYTTGSAVASSSNLTFDGTNLGVGTSSPSSRLSVVNSNYSGSGVIGLLQEQTVAQSGTGETAFGSRQNITNNSTATTTIAGNFIRIDDSTSFGNTIRGLEIQTDIGSNTSGENTGLSAFGKTFGVRGTTDGTAGNTFTPAGVYGETRGTTQGNAIRGYSNTITTASLARLLQEASSFSGTGLLLDFADSSGTFTGNFVDFQNNNVSQFSVASDGDTYIGGNLGIGTTSPSSKLTVAGDGSFGGNLTATGTLDVQGTGTSTLAGNLDLAGNLALTGALFDGTGSAGLDGHILQTTGTSTQWVATSSLGLNDHDSVTLVGENYLSLSGQEITVGAIDLASSNVTGILADANVANDITLTNLTQITNRAISDTTGTLGVTRGGTGATSFNANELLVGNGTGALTTLATSSLGLGDGTFLGLSDTPGSFTTDQIFYQSGSAVTSSADFTFDGFDLSIGFTNATGSLQIAGYDMLQVIEGNSGEDNMFGFGSSPTSVDSSAALGNLGLGEFALDNLTTGEGNIAIGSTVMGVGSAVTGDFNTAVGYSAAVFLESGQNNSFFGASAGTSVTNGSFNVGIGAESLYYNGTANVAVGYNAIGSLSDEVSSSTVLGYSAGASLDGNGNILLGYQAADSLTTGANNIAIGYDIELPSNTADGQLNIGNAIFGTGLTATGTDIFTGNIGIGTTSPSSKLTVAGDGSFGGNLTATGTLDVQGTGTSTFAGNLDLTGNLALTGALYDGLGTAGTDGYILQTTGTSTQWVATSSLGIGGGASTFLGLTDTPGSFTTDQIFYQSGSAVTSSADFTFDGTTFTAPTSSFSGRLSLTGSAANLALGSNWLSGDGDDEGIFVDNAGHVGIGTSTPSVALDIVGDLQLTSTGNTTMDVISDGGVANYQFNSYRNSAVHNVFRANAFRGSQGSPNALQLDDSVFRIIGFGYDSNALSKAGQIEILVDGSPSSGSMPGRIEFSTTPDGANQPEVRMSIVESGNIGIGTTSPSSKLTVAGSGFFGGTLTATGTLDVQGSGTSTFAGNIDLTGALAFTGALYDGTNAAGTDGYILQTTGTSTQWVATSSLGIGGGASTFLGLSDTPGSFTANRLVFASSSGSELTDSANLTFDGTELSVGTSGGGSGGLLNLNNGSASNNITSFGLYLSSVIPDENISGIEQSWITSCGGSCPTISNDRTYLMVNNQLSAFEGNFGANDFTFTGTQNEIDLSGSIFAGGSTHTVFGSRNILTGQTTGQSTTTAFYADASGADRNFAFFAEAGESFFRDGVGIGTSSPSSKLTLENLTLDGAGVSGLDQNLVTTNSVDGVTQFGNRFQLDANNTATTTIVGSILRVADDTSFGNTVRGLEVQTNRGGNTQGENTAFSGFARTFGVRGVTSADAGGDFEPAGGFFETEGTTQGNAIRGFSDSITTASLLSLFQSSSTFAGTGLAMNFGNGGGSFSSTSSKYLDFQNAGTSVFSVSAFGTTTIGDGTTNNMAGLQIGYGGLCVDNDGSCTASTTGTISAVNYETGNSDLAEMYFSRTSLETGEVVTLAGGLAIDRAEPDSTTPIIGVISTKPGLTLGADDTPLDPQADPYPVALSGRVPVQLSTENGPIAAGDPLMLSSIPGVAMKATGTGATIGYALEAFDDTRYYSETYLNQFGDDLVDPQNQPIATNDDPRLNDGCYQSGGGAAGEETTCVPLTSTTTDGQLQEANELAEAESVEEQLAELARVRAETRTTAEGETVRVGQVVMFVDLGYRWVDDAQLATLQALMGTSTITAVGENENETLLDRMVALANGFVDGVLSVFELRADRIETDELCVDGVCVTADDLRTMLEGQTENTAATNASDSTTEESTSTTAEAQSTASNDSGSDADTGNTTTNETTNQNGSATTTSTTTDETGSTTVPVEGGAPASSTPTTTEPVTEDEATTSDATEPEDPATTTDATTPSTEAPVAAVTEDPATTTPEEVTEAPVEEPVPEPQPEPELTGEEESAPAEEPAVESEPASEPVAEDISPESA